MRPGVIGANIDGMNSRLFFRNDSYDGQLVRTMATSGAHMADLGEVMATARAVGRPNAENWYRAWSASATRAQRQAVAADDRVSARQAYLRASEYHRQAYFFLRTDIAGARLQNSYAAHVAAFAAAAALMDHPAELVRIPYGTTTLKGYLFRPDDTGTPRPTIVQPCGYDSTAEAGYTDVPAALERGYNVLLFEGPGQGEALYVQHLPFRVDFEQVLTPVIDWLLTRSGVDPDRLVLLGRSFAGYLAPRAAAFEHRMAALICDPAQPDMGERLPDGLVGRVAAPVVLLQMKLSKDRAEFFGARMAGHGLTDIEQYFAELRRFSVYDVAHRISCPTLIVEAENDFAGGSGERFRAALKCPTTLVRLTREQGADGHCAGLGQEQWGGVVFGWLGRDPRQRHDGRVDAIDQGRLSDLRRRDGDDVEQLLQGRFDLGLPADPGGQLEPQPRITAVGLDVGKPHRAGKTGRQQALRRLDVAVAVAAADGAFVIGGVPVLHPEQLDGPDPAAGQGGDHAVHQVAGQALAAELGQDPGRRQQHRVGRDRRRREGGGPGDGGRRRVEREAGRLVVDRDDLAGAAPGQHDPGEPHLLLETSQAGIDSGRRGRRKFPRDAGSALLRQVADQRHGQRHQCSRHAWSDLRGFGLGVPARPNDRQGNLHRICRPRPPAPGCDHHDAM